MHTDRGELFFFSYDRGDISRDIHKTFKSPNLQSGEAHRVHGNSL